MLLPQRSQGDTPKNCMLLIANTITVASQTDPIRPAHMASTSQTASSNRQATTAQPAKIAACASQKQEADSTSYVGYKA